MAVNYGTKNVNSDTVGWTRLDVLNALEEVFSDLGFHGGTAKTGVPVCALWPGQNSNEEPVSYFNGLENSDPENSDWMHCGGTLSNNSNRAERKFEVTANGTTSYYLQETWQPTGLDVASDTLTVPYNDVLTTGTELKFIPSGGDATNVIGGLALNTSYWVIRVSNTEIKLAQDSTDAGNNTAITLTGIPSAGWGSTTKFFKPQSGSSNQAITTYQGDQLIFNVDATGFHICSGSSYDANKTLESANAANIAHQPGNTAGYLTDNGTTTVTFETKYWIQSEDNTNVESFDKPSDLPKGNVHQSLHYSPSLGMIGKSGSRVVEYCYANDTNATMKASITILPKYTSQAEYFDPYWDVDIAGTVGGAAAEKVLKLRVSRWAYGRSWQYRGRVKSVHVLNSTDGWSGTPTFTISGTDIGGVTPGNDVKFGTNTDESAADVGDGTCSLVFTDYGAGTSFYQKSATGDYAVLKLVHDAAKKWGTTYWVFAPNQTNPYQIQIFGGAYWETQNCWGTTATPDNTSRNDYDWKGLYGFMDGIYSGNTHWSYFIDPYDTQTYYYKPYFATSSQPTDYKLRLKYWKPVAPMDTSFAVIQFLQVVNDQPTEYFTFSLPTDGFGATSPGVDLDHLYLGHIIEYDAAWSANNPSRSIDIELRTPGYEYSTNHPGFEPANTASLVMESCYGYVRNTGSSYARARDRWQANIHTDNDYGSKGILQYYRNHVYDKTDSSMDYYRPIKGIPLMNCFAPCPYYLPDDFVIIQIASTPGLTAYTTGDTITISGSEKYEIIVANVENSVDGLDGVSNGSTIGMAFCARTVG